MNASNASAASPSTPAAQSGHRVFSRKPSSPAVRSAAPAAGSAPSARTAQALEDELGRLKRLGFSTLAECLLSAPKEYVDYSRPVRRALRSHMGTRQYMVLTLVGMAVFDANKRPTGHWSAAHRVDLDTRDEVGTQIQVTVFGNCWPCKDLTLGESLHVHGELELAYGKLQLRAPHFVATRDRGRVAVLYKGKPGQVSGEALADGVARAWERMDEAECLLLAQAGLREAEFEARAGMTAAQLLRYLHQPTTVAQGQAAVALAGILSAEAVVRRAAAARSRTAVAASAVAVNRVLVGELVAELPFQLTGDQKRAVEEIVADLRSPYPMRRLLSGDVGTGKSITFMLPAAAAYAAGAEVAILAPSGPVVSQIVKELRENFAELPVCEVAAGGKIGEGVCVGTTALLHAAKRAKKTFDLVVIDEQHRFSPAQKAALASTATNIVEASATAIPRTLAMVRFGGMNVSVLRECPVKKLLTTRITTDADIDRMDAFIDRVIAAHGQVAVIYPLVGEDAGDDPDQDGSGKASKADDRVSVVEAGAAWSERFPGRVGVLHGRLSTEEKNAVLQAMHERRIDILVSSLVIEVGVTLPSLRAMIVTSPECFGLSQLHQLRGRVARKGGHGYMFLHAGAEILQDAQERLQLLCDCNDGFQLAERDMELRGFGSVDEDGEEQTGVTRTLFWGVTLTHQQLENAGTHLGMTEVLA